MSNSAVIIGASHAAAQTCISLRQGGWGGSITVIGDEAVLPYHRPPLSKDFLSGQKGIEDILIRPAEAYEAANIDMRLGVRVESIDRTKETLLTTKGDEIHYDKLVLATGARIRRLPIGGQDLENVFYLRNRVDVLGIKKKSQTANSVLIIGGGYIGLETAASLRKQGLDVTVLEALPRVLQRVTAPELSTFYKRIHNEEGVEILENITVSEIQKTDKKLSVHTNCGQFFYADMVVIGIGVIPNTELANAAGLKVGDGVLVNEFCQTSDPNIYAAGDVTRHYNPIYGTRLRLESVPNATEQGKVIALHMNGKPKVYNSLPWFWSDQFDLKLQIAGLSTGYDDVIIRGDIYEGRSFAAYYFKENRFIAVDGVNSPRDFMFGKKSLTKDLYLDKAKLADLDIPLNETIIREKIF